jgi:hypothetical protein
MGTVVSSTVIKDVDFLERGGEIGRVYRGRVSVHTLGLLLRRSVVRYSPMYQRGFRKIEEDPRAYDVMLPINDPRLQIDHKRSQEIAIKLLAGQLGNPEVVWNARVEIEEGAGLPVYDPKSRELSIESSVTMPDSAHRSLGYYYADEWKRHSDTIPLSVNVNDRPVSRAEIQELLEKFDPTKAEVFVMVYSLPAEKEGWLYDQLNFDQKPPQRAVGIALNPSKTPSRRFVEALMHNSAIFDATEIETRSNNIGRDSRKLTTNSTLVGAVDDLKKLLIQLEDENPETGAYDDLVRFVAAFFTEYGKHFTALNPGASADARNTLRKESFAISNVMFHALIKLAVEFWQAYRRKKASWEKASEWRDAIAKMAGKDTASGEPILSRDNPNWIGKILIEFYGPTGVAGHKISNTRDTRRAAYDYLVAVAGATDFLRPPGRLAA